MSNEKITAGRRMGVIHDGRFRIGYFLRKMHQKNQGIWQEHCPDKSLTSVQAAALTVLYYQGPCSLSELGASAAIDLSTIRGVVERLHKRELVSLQTDKSDGRKVIVQLEPDGEALLGEMVPIMRRIVDLTLAPLNPAERVAFEYLIQKLIDELDQQTPEP
jgi:DNA-binding MarR family transcriptional regulator